MDLEGRARLCQQSAWHLAQEQGRGYSYPFYSVTLMPPPCPHHLVALTTLLPQCLHDAWQTVGAQKDRGIWSWNPCAAPFRRWDPGAKDCLSETLFPHLLIADGADLISSSCLQDQDSRLVKQLRRQGPSFLPWGFSLEHTGNPRLWKRATFSRVPLRANNSDARSALTPAAESGRVPCPLRPAWFGALPLGVVEAGRAELSWSGSDPW